MNEAATGPRSRFDTPSAGLDLGAVAARQTRKIRLISLAVAIALHGSLAIWKVSAERRAVKPLTTRFIKREPRLVKPLELRKAPKPKRRQMRRRMKRVRAKVDTRGISRAPKIHDVLGSMVRPATEVARTTAFQRPVLEPLVMSGKVAVTKSSGTSIDTSLEMVDVSALDYGRYHAAVIQDPDDRRAIKGFFHLAALAWGTGFTRQAASLRDQYTESEGGMGLRHLAEAVNEFTDVQVKLIGQVWVDSEELLGIPWVYGAPDFRTSEAERRSLGKYLAAGGFVYSSAETGGRDVPMRDAYKEALESVGYKHGRQWVIEKLKNEHPLYHSFFDFDGHLAGVDPTRFHKLSQSIYTGTSGNTVERKDYLEGIHVDGRLAVLIESKNYVSLWQRHYFQDAWNPSPDDKRGYLQFGVNTIVLALTQEGSIAQRLMAVQQ
jgi:hypothetical protein